MKISIRKELSEHFSLKSNDRRLATEHEFPFNPRQSTFDELAPEPSIDVFAVTQNYSNLKNKSVIIGVIAAIELENIGSAKDLCCKMEETARYVSLFLPERRLVDELHVWAIPSSTLDFAPEAYEKLQGIVAQDTRTCPKYLLPLQNKTDDNWIQNVLSSSFLARPWLPDPDAKDSTPRDSIKTILAEKMDLKNNIVEGFLRVLENAPHPEEEAIEEIAQSLLEQAKLSEGYQDEN